MANVRLRYRHEDGPGEVSCETVDEAIGLAAAQLAAGDPWPVEVVVDGRVAVRQPELIERAKQRLGEDDEEDER